MNKTLIRSFAAIAVTISLSTAVSAELITEWDYNDPSALLDASTGTGTTTGSSIPFGFGLPSNSGSSADPISAGAWDGTTNNINALRSGNFPQDPSGSQIVEFETSSAGFTDIAITWDMTSGYRSSRYYQISATTDGTTYVPVSGGVGTGASTPGVGTATVDVFGLITVVFEDGYDPASGGPAGSAPVDYLFDMSYAFPSGSGVENNPLFGVQIAAIHAPTGNDFISSFAGTTDADATSGFDRVSTRYDLVRVTGTAIPEPAGLAFVVFGLAFVALRRK